MAKQREKGLPAMGAPSATNTVTSLTTLTFADLLRYHRTAANLTQEELAERAHLSVDAISTLERGVQRSPRKETVALLADALRLAPDDRAAFAAARHSPATMAATPHADHARNGQPAGAAPELPHGIVTFLFADIEGSSRLQQQLGDGYAKLLADLQELLHTVYLAHHGRELGTQGDRFFAVFAHPDDALSAAVAAQRLVASHPWPEGAVVRLRMGIHTGAALLTAGRYVGVEVVRAAHLAAAGHGGQVLLSRETVEEVAKYGQEFPPDTELHGLGTHRLGDLRNRESITQLVLPDAPGQPARYPPLRTLDLWPIMRARLLSGALLTLTLLALIGLLLPFAVPTFPRALGVVAGLGALMLGTGIALARTRYPSLLLQPWRELRQPVVSLTSGLLSVVVVVLTTLFATTPRQVVTPRQNGGYDFSYTYHQPTHIGGSITIGTGLPFHTLTSPVLNGYLPDQIYRAVWSACVAQLPDLKLPNLEGWKADQCREVPTVANDGESLDGRTTIFHIDPRAVWSDGQPLTADDFLFAFRLITDPNVEGTVWVHQGPSIIPPWTLMHLTKLDARTVRIDWSEPYGNYLTALAELTPLPLHVYARGQYASVYDPATGAYNSQLAARMAGEDNFNLHVPVDNGPFTVQRVDGYADRFDHPLSEYQANQISTAKRLVLARNPHFFSNFFHTPALDQITLETVWKWEWFLHPERKQVDRDAQLAAYRRGDLTVDDGLEALDLGVLGGIPQGEVVINPAPLITTMGFNQRNVAPSARANGGVPFLADRTVRSALVEAFDRCGAVKAVLGLRDCRDPNFHTDEHAAPPSPDYDSSVMLPAYNPTDAAKLLDAAGYLVVGGIRRYRDGTTPLTLTVATISPGAGPFAGFFQRMKQDYARYLHIAVQIQQDTDDIDVTGAFDIAMWQEPVGPNPVDNLGGWLWNSADIPSAKNPDGENFLGLIDPWIVAQDKRAAQTMDTGQRAEVYKGMVSHATEQIDYLPMLINADVALVKPTLCNFKKWPSYGAYLWNIAD
jgi:ABC-type transport system substrate-binding protein/class 3 adenylate cyclase